MSANFSHPEDENFELKEEEEEEEEEEEKEDGSEASGDEDSEESWEDNDNDDDEIQHGNDEGRQDANLPNYKSIDQSPSPSRQTSFKTPSSPTSKGLQTKKFTSFSGTHKKQGHSKTGKHKRKQSFAPGLRNVLDKHRSLLLDSAWGAGSTGRRKLEAGLTLDTVHSLQNIRGTYGVTDYETARSLIMWVINEWPCDPPNSTNPIDPPALGRQCRDLLDNYEPDGDKEDPENSAYLLPEGYRQLVVDLDRMEMIGAHSNFEGRELVDKHEERSPKHRSNSSNSEPKW